MRQQGAQGDAAPARTGSAPRVDKVIGKQKVAKHFELEIADDGFTWQRNRERIAEKAALDGLYVIRTSVPERALGAEGTVRA